MVIKSILMHFRLTKHLLLCDIVQANVTCVHFHLQGSSDLGRLLFMVTSEQVAQLAGVSRATVSRVLNRSANVSEETKKRIYAAITTLGYGSNAVSRAILQQRSHLIALALFGSEDGLNLS